MRIPTAVTGALRLDVSAVRDLELRGLGSGAALRAVVPDAVAADALEQHADGAVPGNQGFDVEQVAGIQRDRGGHAAHFGRPGGRGGVPGDGGLRPGIGGAVDIAAVGGVVVRGVPDGEAQLGAADQAAGGVDVELEQGVVDRAVVHGQPGAGAERDRGLGGVDGGVVGRGERQRGATAATGCGDRGVGLGRLIAGRVHHTHRIRVRRARRRRLVGVAGRWRAIRRSRGQQGAVTVDLVAGDADVVRARRPTQG